MIGYTLEEAKGRAALFLFTHPDAFLNNRGELSQTIREMECRLKDGSVIPTEILGTHVQDSDGAIIGYQMVLRDITPRKAAEKEHPKNEFKLRQSSKMEAIGTMAGGIAHDFNNILGIIFVNTDMALEDIPEGNPARKNIQRIVQASTRASNLVKQILAYSRKAD